MRKQFTLNKEQLDRLLEACKPVPAMMIGGVAPRSPQENANAAWCELGRELGFDGMTVKPVKGEGTEVFTAEVVETSPSKEENSKHLDIERRVEISLAVQRYLRATEKFEAASLEFNESCQALRQKLPRETRLIANVNHQHHLVTCDLEGNFQVEQIDTL